MSNGGQPGCRAASAHRDPGGAIKADALRSALMPAITELVEQIVEQTQGPSLNAAAPLEAWLTIEQVSRYVNVHPKTVLDWIASGELAYGGSGRTIRVKPSDVDSYLRSRAAKARAAESGSIEERALAIAESVRKAG